MTGNLPTVAVVRFPGSLDHDAAVVAAHPELKGYLALRLEGVDGGGDDAGRGLIGEVAHQVLRRLCVQIVVTNEIRQNAKKIRLSPAT